MSLVNSLIQDKNEWQTTIWHESVNKSKTKKIKQESEYSNIFYAWKNAIRERNVSVTYTLDTFASNAASALERIDWEDWFLSYTIERELDIPKTTPFFEEI